MKTSKSMRLNKMNVKIKKAIRAGNSSAVILPRAWLDKEVRVELVKKTQEIMLQETLKIVKEYVAPEEIVGIYLVGSYARGEENRDSDIDILVISENTDREIIHEGIYNLLIVSEELLKWKLKNDLFPIGQMIKEAKPLINSSYLNEVKIIVTRKNVKWYIDTTEEKLNLMKEILNLQNGKKISDRVVYSLVLRVRTLYIIQKLIKKQVYSKRELIRLILKISGSNNAYEAYLAVKNDSEETYMAEKEEAEKLYAYLRKQLDSVRKLLRH
jgi:predicted nucleotidyltransferase